MAVPTTTTTSARHGAHRSLEILQELNEREACWPELDLRPSRTRGRQRLSDIEPIAPVFGAPSGVLSRSPAALTVMAQPSSTCPGAVRSLQWRCASERALGCLPRFGDVDALACDAVATELEHSDTKHPWAAVVADR